MCSTYFMFNTVKQMMPMPSPAIPLQVLDRMEATVLKKESPCSTDFNFDLII